MKVGLDVDLSSFSAYFVLWRSKSLISVLSASDYLLPALGKRRVYPKPVHSETKNREVEKSLKVDLKSNWRLIQPLYKHLLSFKF